MLGSSAGTTATSSKGEGRERSADYLFYLGLGSALDKTSMRQRCVYVSQREIFSPKISKTVTSE